MTKRTTTTPSMEHDTESWTKARIAKAIYDGCTIPSAAERLGISKETAAKYYMKVMVACSIRAVHELYGKVRVFSDEKSHYFILHPENDKIIGYELLDYSDWKCAPDLEDLDKVPFYLRKT